MHAGEVKTPEATHEYHTRLSRPPAISKAMRGSSFRKDIEDTLTHAERLDKDDVEDPLMQTERYGKAAIQEGDDARSQVHKSIGP